MQLNFDRERNLHLPFVTPIATFLLPNAAEINRALEPAILEREAKDTGLQISNVGGWHSGADLLSWPEVRLTDLEESLDSSVRHLLAFDSRIEKFSADIKLRAWANVNRAGDFNAFHSHPNQHWSGVYYVRAGDYGGDRHPHAGHIELIDPRGCINNFSYPGRNQFGSSVKFAPRDGMLLLFPSWLQHYVNPFVSDTLRISLAFNARIESFEAS